MNPFVKFMASTTGRIVRIVAGVVLIVLGLLVIGWHRGNHRGDVGSVPLLAGRLRLLRLRPPVWRAAQRAEDPGWKITDFTGIKRRCGKCASPFDFAVLYFLS